MPKQNIVVTDKEVINVVRGYIRIQNRYPGEIHIPMPNTKEWEKIRKLIAKEKKYEIVRKKLREVNK